MTKRQYIATSRGGGVFGVEMSIKITKNTIRTSTIITLQQQKHFKNECNQTNKDQRNKEQRNKQTNTQTTNKKTNAQIDKEQTDTTPP